MQTSAGYVNNAIMEMFLQMFLFSFKIIRWLKLTQGKVLDFAYFLDLLGSFTLLNIQMQYTEEQ